MKRVFNSKKIINDLLDIYPTETLDFLKKFSGEYGFECVSEKLDLIGDMKILLIGDGIIDEYHYCETMNKSAKSPVVVNKYLSHEIFAGGAFAVANHVAGLCKEVNLVTLLGQENSREDFIRSKLRPNIRPNFFYRNDGPTIVKKRYINQYMNQKLFEVNYLNECWINAQKEAEIIEYLRYALSYYDLVMVSDFGHGFITGKIIKVIERLSKKVAVNTQTNGANAGFNFVTKYSNPFYVCLDEAELRLSAQDRFGDIEEVTKDVKNMINAHSLIVTQGRHGSIGIDKKNSINRTPIFSSKVVDTVGAGDAFFAFTAPCFAKGMPLDLVSFIGNAVGALAVRIIGNKRSVEKYELLEFINAILK